jgi:hypothetical protein
MSSLVAERTRKDEQVNPQVAIEAIHARRDQALAIIRGVTDVFKVLSTSVPIYTSYKVVSTIAAGFGGKTTVISATVSYGVAAAVGSGTGAALWASSRAKSKDQSHELIRLRQKITQLESEREDKDK